MARAKATTATFTFMTTLLQVDQGVTVPGMTRRAIGQPALFAYAIRQIGSLGADRF
ncbi:hypothetical protein PS3A_22930 [Pseudomonas sp. 3A(2025)]